MKFEMTVATQMGRRPYQEDRNVVYWIPDVGYLLAVFDGHGGTSAAEYCSQRLIPLCHEVYDNFLFPVRPTVSFEIWLRQIFKVLNDDTELFGPGCAASIVFIPKDGSEAVVGVLGDAPVLVKKADGALWLSPEHNVRTNREEADAAIARGGFVQSGYLFIGQSGGGLQMSRALGDRHLGPVLNREPQIFRVPVGAGSFVLVASDGLFDPSHASNVSEQIAAHIEGGALAEELVQNAVNEPTYDNVTAILVKLA